MRKPLAVLVLIGWTFLSQTSYVAAQVRPRIRAVTAFIEIDQNNYAEKIAEAQKFLLVAKQPLNEAGFEGAGGRITTQPFPQYTRGMKPDDAVAFISKLREAAQKGPSGLNIGSAMIHDSDDTAPVDLLV